MEDDISRILQFHDSFPPSIESYQYEDDASFMSSSASSYLKLPSSGLADYDAFAERVPSPVKSLYIDLNPVPATSVTTDPL